MHMGKQRHRSAANDFMDAQTGLCLCYLHKAGFLMMMIMMIMMMMMMMMMMIVLLLLHFYNKFLLNKNSNRIKDQNDVCNHSALIFRCLSVICLLLNISTDIIVFHDRCRTYM